MTSSTTSTSPPMRIICTSAILALFIQGKGSSAVGFQRFLVRPESVEVTEGTDVFLECVVEDQQGKAQWTKDGFALGFERGVPGYPRYAYSGDPALGQHHLLISSVTITEDGEYQCQVGPTDTNPPIWAAANVTVLVAPRSVEFSGWRDGSVVEVVAGSSLTLECVVKHARPAPSVWWYKDGIQLDQGLVEESVEASTEPRRWNARSRLLVRASAEDDGKLYTCEADHPALRSTHAPLLASITLSVLHPPQPPTISGYRTGEVLVSGERRTLVCRVSGGNPRPRVTWHGRRGLLLDDTSSVDASVVVNTHQLTASAAHDGALYQCQVNSDLLKKPLVANVTLTVYYVPSFVSLTGPTQVEEGAPISLSCETSKSNPPASLIWKVQGETMTSEPETMVRVSTGGWITTSHLTHHVVRSRKVTEVVVECRALNPAIDQTVSKTRIIAITKPAGPPRLEGDLRRKFLAGTTFDLACSSVGGHPPPTIRMYKGDEEVMTEIVRELNVTRGRAKVRLTPADNGAKVACEVTSGVNSTPLTTSAKLAVRFPPWEVLGSVTPTTVEEGAIVSLTCESSSSLPPANITWRSGGATIQGATLTTTRAAFGGTSTRSELQLRTTAGDDGKVFHCEAGNHLGPPVHTSLTLQVLHPPVWVSKPPPQIDVYEGADLVVHAAAAANPGPLRYWWRRGQETLMGTGQQLQLGRVSRQHTGYYFVSAYSQRGAVNASFYLNVQYGPENVETTERLMVKEGGRVNTQCSAGGNPAPHLTWTRYPVHTYNSSGPILGSGVGVARLVIESATRADTDVYFCHAHNIVSSSSPPARSYVVVEQAVTAAPDVSGLGGSWAAVGGSGRLVCRVRAAPPPTFVWSSQSGLILLNSDKYTIHEPQLQDGLVLWASVLQVREIMPVDYTTYLCTAHNAHGSDSLILALNPPARPHPPVNFTVINVTHDDLWLSWTPNLDGGAPSGYTVKYRSSGSLTYQYVEVGGGGTSSVRLSGLSPAREYTVALQARNEHGSSNYVSRTVLTPPAGQTGEATSLQGVAGSRRPAGGEDLSPNPGGLQPSAAAGAATTSRVPRLILLIMTLTGAALLALNVSIIACFVRRRAMNRNSSASASSKTASLGTFGTTPASTPGVHPSEVFLSLNSISTNNLSNSPSEYQKGEVIPAAGEEPSGLAGDGHSSSSSNTPAEEAETFQFDQNLVHFPTEPDVCSVGSSVYDNVPSEDPRRGSMSYPAGEDQVSLCSNRSSSSRTYCHQGLLRPLPSLLTGLEQQATPQLIQDTLRALPCHSQQHHRHPSLSHLHQLLNEPLHHQHSQPLHQQHSQPLHQQQNQPLHHPQHQPLRQQNQPFHQQHSQPLHQQNQPLHHQPLHHQHNSRLQPSHPQQTLHKPSHHEHQQRPQPSQQPHQSSPQQPPEQRLSPLPQPSQQIQLSPRQPQPKQQPSPQPSPQQHQASPQPSPSQPQPHQKRPQQQQQQQQQQQEQQPSSQPRKSNVFQHLSKEALWEPPAYTNLNPNDLFTLKPDNYHVACKQTSFTSGPASGYRTLGARRRRQNPVHFATLQRPRSSRSAKTIINNNNHNNNNNSASELYDAAHPCPPDAFQLKPLRCDFAKSSSSTSSSPHVSVAQHENSGSSGYSSSPHREVNGTVTGPSLTSVSSSQGDVSQRVTTPQGTSVGTSRGSPLLKGNPLTPTDTTMTTTTSPTTTQGRMRSAHNHIPKKGSSASRKAGGENDNTTENDR
ncbi:nephrin-like [Panulirus ornatus]|uniref:nephrin-like n=1 Tax=Panulirus ornatus TaxID=150431 RepID=UPI003A8870A2